MENTISISISETFTRTILRQSVELNLQDYPELSGLTTDEIKHYLEENIDTIKPTNNLYQSLLEQCHDLDVTCEIISNEQTSIQFN